jgi:hypothetical protein
VQYRQGRARGRRAAEELAPRNFVLPQLSHQALLKQVLDETKTGGTMDFANPRKASAREDRQPTLPRAKSTEPAALAVCLSHTSVSSRGTLVDRTAMRHQRNTQAVTAAFTVPAGQPVYREPRTSSRAGRRSLRADKPFMSAAAARFVESSLSAYERMPRDQRRIPRTL